ncbi:helix-hairpin-helix domain-containing protein [Bacillus sp. RG28]|uniref:Helix-hairpin-helix domain-containing protein n=1 Tax=Gottfriedia endophytica TaxID=2820819 RepID=A0A940NKA5_9BACI|nr:ComEA family DNA-binding protein [Gottfriedia endophytica]MBP0723749.1 helix-hairpin-helix domain-containing protein [Gottfriedia endophytica]
MPQLFKNKLVWLAGVIVVCLIYTGYQTVHSNQVDFSEKEKKVLEDKNNIFKQKETNVKNIIVQTYMVDVKGAVVKPGIYQVGMNNRVDDAIKLAGGFKSTADSTKVNLAQKIKDEMVIYVPAKGEKGLPSNDAGITNDVSGQADSKKVDINHATAVELQTIPGVGPSKAQKIIDYIQQKGPFTSIEQLDNVSGFGPKTVENIRPYVIVQ